MFVATAGPGHQGHVGGWGSSLRGQEGRVAPSGVRSHWVRGGGCLMAGWMERSRWL